MSFVKKKKAFCRLEKENIGRKKNLSVEKKDSVGEFPLPKTDMSRMSGIPCNARPKNGRGGKKRPRAYRGGKKEKSLSFGEKKNLSVGKTKCRLENFPCQKRTCPECPEFPGMQDRKTAEAGKKRPRASRGKKREKIRHLEKKFFVGWKNKMLVGKKTCRLKNKKSV